MDEIRQWQRVRRATLPDCLRGLPGGSCARRTSECSINRLTTLAVDLHGHKELLGMWIAQTEGAKFWLQVLTELQNRGVKDIFIACVDGLTSLPEAIETVYPHTRVQLCMVHLVRNSLRYVSYKHMKAVATDLKAIYSAST